jgi:hypothetical protein
MLFNDEADMRAKGLHKVEVAGTEAYEVGKGHK